MEAKSTKAERLALILFLLILGLLIAVPIFAQSPLSITLFPAFSFEPATVHITVKVQRSPLNRWLEIVLDGDQYYSSSTFAQDENSPVTTQFFRYDLPAGVYQAIAILTTSDGKQTVARSASATVVGRELYQP